MAALTVSPHSQGQGDGEQVLKRICEERGLKEGNTSTPGAFVIERAFAES